LAVEFDNNKFEKRTPEQIDSDSLRKPVYTIESFHVIHFFGYDLSDNLAPLARWLREPRTGVLIYDTRHDYDYDYLNIFFNITKIPILN
jgi:hypothetical protein